MAFVTTVGNGGSLPDSSGLKQLEYYLTPIENCSMDRLNKPFPYIDVWDWSHDDDYDCISDPEGKLEAAQYGHFAFVEPNETGFTWDLIVDVHVRARCGALKVEKCAEVKVSAF